MTWTGRRAPVLGSTPRATDVAFRRRAAPRSSSRSFGPRPAQLDVEQPASRARRRNFRSEAPPRRPRRSHHPGARSRADAVRQWFDGPRMIEPPSRPRRLRATFAVTPPPGFSGEGRVSLAPRPNASRAAGSRRGGRGGVGAPTKRTTFPFSGLAVPTAEYPAVPCSMAPAWSAHLRFRTLTRRDRTAPPSNPCRAKHAEPTVLAIRRRRWQVANGFRTFREDHDAGARSTRHNGRNGRPAIGPN